MSESTNILLHTIAKIVRKEVNTLNTQDLCKIPADNCRLNSLTETSLKKAKPSFTVT